MKHAIRKKRQTYLPKATLHSGGLDFCFQFILYLAAYVRQSYSYGKSDKPGGPTEQKS